MKTALKLWVSIGLILTLVGIDTCIAQTYEVLTYNLNGTPVNGIKIKTNIPYTNGSQMVNLHIEGYSYGLSSPLGINIVWYIYSGNFVNTGISSWGNDTPTVSLANEGGKVVVFIHDKVYYQRFKVTAFAKGMSETSTWFQGWTAVDQALSGTNTVTLSYKNTFGNVYATGKVGIGTKTPQATLAVNGNILATEVKVKNDITVPDYVFDPDYELPELGEIESFVKEHKHLPEIPSAADIEKDGLNLAEVNLLLLKKIEELRLHLIEQEKKIDRQDRKIEHLAQQLERFSSQNIINE